MLFAMNDLDRAVRMKCSLDILAFGPMLALAYRPTGVKQCLP